MFLQPPERAGTEHCRAYRNSGNTSNTELDFGMNLQTFSGKVFSSLCP